MEKNKIALFFFLLFFSQNLRGSELFDKKIEIKKISEERINRLTQKYEDFIWQERIKKGTIGTIQLATIGSIVSALHFSIKKNTSAQNISHDEWGLTWQWILNNTCITVVVALMLNGINSSLNNISDAFYGSVTNKCETQILRRFLFEIRRYTLITFSLKREDAFISEQEILISYNRIISALEHIIAWSKLDYIEPEKKNVFSSIISFAETLNEYEFYLYQAQSASWSKEACKKLSLITHSFLLPWINLLDPEISHDQ